MTKIDKSLYSKAEWRIIKEQRRQEKSAKKTVESFSAPSADLKYYLVCVKHGNKYSSEYVNTLYRMSKRHCTLDFEFVCFTDDIKGLDKGIKLYLYRRISKDGGLNLTFFQTIRVCKVLSSTWILT